MWAAVTEAAFMIAVQGRGFETCAAKRHCVEHCYPGSCHVDWQAREQNEVAENLHTESIESGEFDFSGAAAGNWSAEIPDQLILFPLCA